MALKRRYILDDANDNYRIRMFHIIDHSADVTTLSFKINSKKSPELNWEKMGDQIYKNISLNFTMSVIKTGSLDLFHMVRELDPNYDAAYSYYDSSSEARFIYVLVEDKVKSKSYYLACDSDLSQKTWDKNTWSFDLYFTDRLENLQEITQFEDVSGTPTRTSDWNSRFPASTYLAIFTGTTNFPSNAIYKSLLVDATRCYQYLGAGSFNLSLQHDWEFSSDAVEGSATYPYSISDLIFETDQLRQSSPSVDQYFKNGQQIIDEINLAFNGCYVSEGLLGGTFRHNLEDSFTPLGLPYIKKGISIKVDTFMFKSTGIIYGRYTGSTLYDSYTTSLKWRDLFYPSVTFFPVNRDAPGVYSSYNKKSFQFIDIITRFCPSKNASRENVFIDDGGSPYPLVTFMLSPYYDKTDYSFTWNNIWDYVIGEEINNYIYRKTQYKITVKKPSFKTPYVNLLTSHTDTFDDTTLNFMAKRISVDLKNFTEEIEFVTIG